MAAADPVARNGTGDGLGNTGALNATAAGPDRYEQAALDNNAAEGRAGFKRPAAGTSAKVRFTDAPAVSTTTLSPFLQSIVGHAKRVRTVGIDATALSGSLAAAKVSVDLFSDVTLPLDTSVALSDGAGVDGLRSTTYSASGPSATAAVTIIDGDVHAAIWQTTKEHGTKKYGIKPLGGGRHLVFEDGRTYPGEDEAPGALQDGAKRPAGKPAGGARIAAATPVIDVMVAFDDSAQAAYGSVTAARADIVEMINISNLAYFNSDNDQQLALTHIVDLNYTPNAADGTDNDSAYLAAIRSTVDGIVDDLHTLRNDHAADLVSVVSNMSSFCGVAYLPASANPAELDAFSLVDFGCAVGNLSFPHELGHNMCAHHDPDNAGANPCEVDGFGHFGVAENLRTIMSYGNATNGCTTCVRIPYFSNPNVTANGWVTGILGSRDNSRVLEVTDLDVANYRAPQFSAAVAGIDGNSCIFNTVDDAIELAPAGSTIYIAPGTHVAEVANVNFNVDKSFDLVKGTADCEPTVGGSSTDVILRPNPGSTNDAVVEVRSSSVVRFNRITIEGGNSAESTLFVWGAGDATLDDSIVRGGTNPSATTGGGGVRVSGPSAKLTSINDSQIEDNTAQLGGGIFVDDGTVTIDGEDNVENNTANVHGGGIYATNNATVVMLDGADVLANSAAQRGGGVYLNGASTLSVDGMLTLIGAPGVGNTANLGGGVFAEGGSTVTLVDNGAVAGNTAGFGGGLYGLGAGTTIRVDREGIVSGNSATTNGGGILVTQSALADLNAGADVVLNSAIGWGGGVAVFTPATLDADGDDVDRVDITNNSAGTVGGGIWSSGVSTLDTVTISGNTATAEGGGLYVPSTGTVTITDDSTCGPGPSLSKEHYCNEFRSNTAGTTGGAVYTNGGDFSAVQTAFVGNAASNAAVLIAFGDSVINVRAALVISNTETVAAVEALITGHDTSSTTLVGVTFADHTEAILDTDDSATATVSRVLTTTGTLGLVAVPAGGCNVSAVASGLPGLLVAAVAFTSTARTDYLPVAGAPGLDRCLLMGGHASDIDDTTVIDVAPAGLRDYDVGAFEAPA